MDYAKQLKQPATSPHKIPGWVWFFTGLVTGIFVSFLFYLDQVRTSETMSVEDRPVARVVKPEEVAEGIKLDFYEMLKNFEVPVEEYGSDSEKITLQNEDIFVLQVASFQKPEDADSLRARLILLGLDAYVKKSDVKGEFWHRVLVGPINSDLLLNRAQDKLAEAGLLAIPLRVQM